MLKEALFEAGLVIHTSQQHTEDVPNHTHGWDVDINEMTKRTFEVDIRGVHTSYLQLSLMRYHTAIMIDGGYPEGAVIFSCIQTNGLIHEKNRTYHTTDMIMLDDHRRFDLIVSEPCYIYTLAIEKKRLEKVFESLFNSSFDDVYRSQDIYLDGEQVEAYYALFKEKMRLLKESSEENISPEVYATLEEEILHKLIAHFRFRPREVDYLPRYIREGRELLHKHIHATYTIADMVEDLQVSKRTIQHGFKHYLGFTPKEYQQYIRLNGIRDTILNMSDPDISLSEIAAKYNYFHLGHFSTEYRKFFGETPSQTLQRLKQN
jgi:AraC family ethanolamine operon transcriptional activator